MHYSNAIRISFFCFFFFFCIDCMSFLPWCNAEFWCYIAYSVSFFRTVILQSPFLKTWPARWVPKCLSGLKRWAWPSFVYDTIQITLQSFLPLRSRYSPAISAWGNVGWRHARQPQSKSSTAESAPVRCAVPGAGLRRPHRTAMCWECLLIPSGSLWALGFCSILTSFYSSPSLWHSWGLSEISERWWKCLNSGGSNTAPSKQC